jgi:AmiR/NasT family two-component response regulator
MRRTRVLIAEDQTLIRLDLHRLLEAAGYDVCGMAIDGLEAVECAADLQPDLVVLDVKMPRLDGVEAARRILAAYHVPIVMLTAYGYGELISRGLDAGVVGFVVKPFGERDLLDALRDALREHPDADALVYIRRGDGP